MNPITRLWCWSLVSRLETQLRELLPEYLRQVTCRVETVSGVSALLVRCRLDCAVWEGRCALPDVKVLQRLVLDSTELANDLACRLLSDYASLN